MKNDYTGLSKTIYSSDLGEVLTPEKIDKTISYLQSDEYHKKENEKEMIRVKGYMLINKALNDGVITLKDWVRCKISIELNGILLVNSKLVKKLNKITL